MHNLPCPPSRPRALVLLLLFSLPLLTVGVVSRVPPPLRCPPPDPLALERLRAQAPAVQLWLAPISFFDSRVVHPHFLYARHPDDPAPHRVEVRETSAAGSHLWIDQSSPLQDQGRGLCLLGERTGAAAETTITALEAAARPPGYPWARRYFPLPGPNSNTFAAAILRASGWPLSLPPQALGQHFPVPLLASEIP